MSVPALQEYLSVSFFIMVSWNQPLSEKVTIINELGLHARAASKIAALAENANAKVWILKDEQEVDASSIIDILTLGCAKGSEITLKVDDASDIHILNSVVDLVKKGFEE